MADPNEPEDHVSDPDEDMDTVSDDDFAFEDAEDMQIATGLNDDVGVGPTRSVPLRFGGMRDQMNYAGFMYNDRNKFVQNYRVLSVGFLENRGHQNLENGGKVILPPSALQQLSRNSSALLSPMMFKATKKANQKFTHCGVLEFIAEEDICYMPNWMMGILGAQDNEFIQIERVELPKATFAQFQPQSVDFLEISNPKAILENTLRFFSCLTKGDMIAIHYNSRIYQLLVLETLPGDAVNIIECDLNVDFAAPVGYVSPSSREDDELEDGSSEASSAPINKFVPFLGSGNRLNGKEVATGSVSKPNNQVRGVRGTPDFDWKIGDLQFTRKFKKHGGSDKGNSAEKKFSPFGGTGLSLKKPKNTTDP